jgi:hypothetical protein
MYLKLLIIIFAFILFFISIYKHKSFAYGNEDNMNAIRSGISILNIQKQKIDDKVSNIQNIYGDIDYSDNFKNNWKDTDNYYFENNNSDILFVLFSGMGFGNSKPTFIFNNFLKKYKNIDKLFLRDLKYSYYLTGLNNLTTDLESTLSFLNKKFIKNKNYKKIVGIGCSAGGYASILYGILLNFDKVISFSPQVVLNNKKIDIIKDTYYAPNECKRLIKYRKDNFYKKCLDLKNFIPFNINVEIHCGKYTKNGCDRRHALYIKHKNCNVIEYNSNSHIIALELRNNGILKKIFDNEIN